MRGFVGPSAQIWLSARLWLRAGAGLGYALAPGDESGMDNGLIGGAEVLNNPLYQPKERG